MAAVRTRDRLGAAALMMRPMTVKKAHATIVATEVTAIDSHISSESEDKPETAELKNKKAKIGITTIWAIACCPANRARNQVRVGDCGCVAATLVNSPDVTGGRVGVFKELEHRPDAGVFALRNS